MTDEDTVATTVVFIIIFKRDLSHMLWFILYASAFIHSFFCSTRRLIFVSYVGSTRGEGRYESIS